MSRIAKSTPGTVQVGDQLFGYQWWYESWDYSRTVLARNATSCDSVTLSAALDVPAEEYPSGPGSSTTLHLLQADADRQILVLNAPQVTSTVTWPLTGHAFKLYFDPASVNTMENYLNATLHCWSTNAKAS